jgi:capsular exopolysaccharide synthesis family protein
MDLEYLLVVARRNVLALFVFAFGGIGLGFLQYTLTEPTYRSTATVILLNKGTSVGELADGRNYAQSIAPSYARVARMSIVLSPVIRQLGLRTTSDELALRVSANLQPGSVVLTIAVEDHDAATASAVTNAIVQQLGTALDTLSPSNPNATASVTMSTVASSAPASAPVSPNRTLSLAGGLVAGLLLGAGFVAIRQSLGMWRVRTRQDVQHLTSEPILATVPDDAGVGLDPSSALRPPSDETADSFRILQMNLTHVREQAPGCLVVASAKRREGRTTTAINLGIASSRAGLATLIIDADILHASVAGGFGLRQDRGLSTVLDGTSTLEHSIQTWADPADPGTTLDILASGVPTPNPAHRFASEGMADVLRAVRSRYALVIIDSPPLFDGAAGWELAVHADRALVVISASRTTGRSLLRVLMSLRGSGTDVVGVLVNRTPSGSRGRRREPAVAHSPTHGRGRRTRDPSAASGHWPDTSAVGISRLLGREHSGVVEAGAESGVAASPVPEPVDQPSLPANTNGEPDRQVSQSPRSVRQGAHDHPNLPAAVALSATPPPTPASALPAPTPTLPAPNLPTRATRSAGVPTLRPTSQDAVDRWPPAAAPRSDPGRGAPTRPLQLDMIRPLSASSETVPTHGDECERVAPEGGPLERSLKADRAPARSIAGGQDAALTGRPGAAGGQEGDVVVGAEVVGPAQELDPDLVSQLAAERPTSARPLL